jgi:hypothetical protein
MLREGKTPPDNDAPDLFIEPVPARSLQSSFFLNLSILPESTATPISNSMHACSQRLSIPTPLRINERTMNRKCLIGMAQETPCSICDREYETRKVHHRLYDEELADHHRLLLRAGDR